MMSQLPTPAGVSLPTETLVTDPNVLLDRAAWLLDEAETDPIVLQALVERPLEAISAAGMDVWFVLKLALDLPDASDREVVDVLRGHVRRAQRHQQLEADCGNCGVEYCRTQPRPLGLE
jgi:hypothetical protein